MPNVFNVANLVKQLIWTRVNWTWFVTEGSEDEEDFRFFGYVIGFEEEWGYFVLSELESVRGPLGLAIERDLYFRSAPFSEVMKQFRNERGL